MLRTFKDMTTIKQLLTAAEQESLADSNDPDPGAEHVFLAALGLPDGTAARAFAAVGGTAGGLRTAIRTHHEGALADLGLDVPELDPASAPTPGGRGLMRAKGSTRELLKSMSALAKEHPGPGFVSAHVVIAGAKFEHGTLAGALAGMGIDRESLKQAALATLQAHS